MACELVAFRFLTYLSQKDLIDHLLFELPIVNSDNDDIQAVSQSADISDLEDERSPLLAGEEHDLHPGPLRPPSRPLTNGTLRSSSFLMQDATLDDTNMAKALGGMNALEIAAVADAKKFLSQKPVQAVVEDIWNGDIIFWSVSFARLNRKIARSKQQSATGT